MNLIEFGSNQNFPLNNKKSHLYDTEANYIYVIKCLMKHHPLKLTVLALSIFTFLFGYALKICERLIIFEISLNFYLFSL